MITNQISQVVAVIRHICGLHRNAIALPNLNFLGGSSSGASGSTGGSSPPIALRTRCSKSATTVSASSCLPWVTRNRGDSGSDLRHHSTITIGMNVITCAQRQPCSLAGTTNRPIRAAPTKPNEKKPDSAPTNQPRRCFGTNSDRNGAMITLSAPAPAPAMIRKIRKLSKFQETAASNDAIA